MLRSLVGSEMCIRDRFGTGRESRSGRGQWGHIGMRRVRGFPCTADIRRGIPSKVSRCCMTHIYGVDKQAHDISCSTQQVLQHITNSHMHVYTLIQYTIMFTHRHSQQSIAVNSSRYSCCCVDCTIGRDFLRGLQWTRSREGGIPSGLLTVPVSYTHLTLPTKA